MLWIQIQEMVLFLRPLFRDPRTKGWKWGGITHSLVSLTIIIPSNPLVNSVFCSHDLMTCRPRILCSGVNVSTREHNNDSIEQEAKTNTWLNRKLRLTPGHFGLFMPLNQQTRKEVIVWLVWLILFTKEKLNYYSTMKEKKTMSGIQEIFLGLLLVLSCPVIKVNNLIQAGLLMAQTI